MDHLWKGEQYSKSFSICNAYTRHAEKYHYSNVIHVECNMKSDKYLTTV